MRLDELEWSVMAVQLITAIMQIGKLSQNCVLRALNWVLRAQGYALRALGYALRALNYAIIGLYAFFEELYDAYLFGPRIKKPRLVGGYYFSRHRDCFLCDDDIRLQRMIEKYGVVTSCSITIPLKRLSLYYSGLIDIYRYDPVSKLSDFVTVDIVNKKSSNGPITFGVVKLLQRSRVTES